MVVPLNSLSLNNIEKSNADKDSRIKRRLNKEGIDSSLDGRYYS